MPHRLCDALCVPRIDDGPAHGSPGKQLKSAWVTLTTEEARDLLTALAFWDQDLAEGEARERCNRVRPALRLGRSEGWRPW